MASAGSRSLLADGALVESPRDGDEAAFEELFRRHYPTVYRILLRVTGSPEDAEDLTQEVFLRLHERPLEHGANVGGWLYRAATNAGFNAVRARRRQRSRILRWVRLEWPVRRAAGSAEAEAEGRDAAEAVRTTLAMLPERDRTVLVLRYSGLSYAEIAEAIGVRQTSVGTILARAERALRRQYAALYGDPAHGEHGGGTR